MGRLIDEDDVLKVLCHELCHPGAYCPDGYCLGVRETLKDVPTADTVSVVRCGECKHMTADGRCLVFADDCLRPSASDFCSKGERKTMNDYIERQDAIDTHCAICPDKGKCPDRDFICPDRELFRMIKPAYPDLDESCDDCPLYDKEKHNCPRFCRVIPETIKELKQQKIGKWLPHPHEPQWDVCSICGIGVHRRVGDDEYSYCFCPWCGAKMGGGR